MSTTLTSPTSEPVVEQYLAALVSQLSVGRHAADDLVAEVRDHLIDAVGDAPDPVQAPALVVASFGPAEELARALSEEHHRSSLARAARRSLRWAGAAAVVVTAVASATTRLAGAGGIGVTDGAAIGTAIVATVVAAVCGWRALSAGRVLEPSGREVRAGAVACAVSGLAVLVGFAAATALGGDLVADAVRGTSTIAKLTVATLGILLATAVTSGIFPLGRAWRSLTATTTV